MKVSLNQVKQLIDFELPPVDELVVRINSQLGGVEEVIDLTAKYKDAKIVKVVECEKHQNADRLSVCKIDAGTGDLIQVVCGAPNVHGDMWAIWLPPGSTVPATYDDAEPFVLEPKELRGVVSNGMLAAADELEIGSDHEGIIEINPDEWRPQQTEVTPGASFAEAYGLDDTIIDIENKMFTHRPDLFGQLGVAREIAGILGHKFTSPSWYTVVPKFENADGLQLEFFNDAGKNVPRFMAVAMKNVEIKPSPLWLQTALVAMGSKPINNVVDVTNYIMLLTAQPTHAYDYDKLRGAKLGARMAKKGETIKAINGKTYQLDENDIVIADAEGPVGLGGIMGGFDSEVGWDTKNVVLEVANFDMYTVRKMSMRHGIFTDALTRFNKGQSPLQNDHVMNLLMMSVKDVSPAEQASDVFDLGKFDDCILEGDIHKADSLGVTAQFINDRLGVKLTDDEQTKLLENVEIKVDKDADGFEIFPPFWRTDIELPEDIIEEVGRLYGYDKLPRELPTRSIAPAPKNALRELKQSIRETLAKSGANEVLTYSFVHENVMKKAGQNPEHAFRLGNALSPDLQFYRTSLTPSLLDKISMNARAGYDEFALFEIGKTHFKGEMDEAESDVPNEDTHLALVMAYGDKDHPDGAPYFAAKKIFEQLPRDNTFALQPLTEFDIANDEWGGEFVAPYAPERSAVLVKDGMIFGVVGEFKPGVARVFKLPKYSAGFEVHFDVLKQVDTEYIPLSKYPSVTQDISLKVAPDVPHDAVYESARKALETFMKNGKFEATLKTLAIYQPDDAKSKTITLRVTIASYEKTLKDSDVAILMDAIAAAAAESVHAEWI